MASVQPIKPNEVAALKVNLIPDYVIEAFNQMIAENYKVPSKSATVYQDAVVKRILELSPKEFVESLTPITRQLIFDKGWLDIEEIFRSAGWDVKYDKPSYDESYEAYFKFTAK